MENSWIFYALNSPNAVRFTLETPRSLADEARPYFIWSTYLK